MTEQKKKDLTKEEAEEAVVNYLRERGECPVNELDEAIISVGISKYALRKAKEELKDEGKIRYRKLSEGQANGVKWNILLDD